MILQQGLLFVIEFKHPPRISGRYTSDTSEPRFLQRTLAMWVGSAARRLWHTTKYQEVMREWYMSQAPVVRSFVPRITWVGHATFLIQIGGFNILTDPVFGSITPFFSRNVAPGISLDQLPPIDLLLISHNHWDHLHGPTLLKLRNKLERWNTEILVPEGDERVFARLGFSTVRSFRWGQHYDYETAQRAVRCTFLPTQHWSRHGMFDRNKSLWGSWMISDENQTIYFAGDSAYGPHFKEIAQYFPVVDVALMPIAPCEPYEWLRSTHMNAEEAIMATKDLNARWMIPMHWGVFNFGYDHPTAAIERVMKEWKSKGFAPEQLLLPKIGQALIVPHVAVKETKISSLEL